MEMMILLVVVGVAAIAIKRNLRERGERFVRAVEYIELRKAGRSVDLANFMTMITFSRMSDPDEDRAKTLHAMAISRAHFGGKQLPVIALARAAGFTQ